MRTGTVAFGQVMRPVHISGGEVVGLAQHGPDGWTFTAHADHPRFKVVENMTFNALAALGGAVAMASIAEAVHPEDQDQEDSE